ncbi:MAG: hypothetical protein WC813_03660 [Patescibacteria group bacterium]|jgi:hypothetical protein
MAIVDLLKIPPVRSFLFDGKVLAEFRDVAAKNELPTERAPEFLDLCNAVIDGTLPMAEVPGIIGQAFGKDEATSKKISADIFGYRILPLESFVPGIREQIIAWGGKVEDHPARPIGKEKISAFLWSKRMDEAAGLGFSDVLVKRLGLLIEGRVKGEKDAEALKTFFGRPLTIGGLALSKEKVDALLAEVEREAPYIEIVSEEDWKKLEAEREKAEKATEEPEEGGVLNPAVTPDAPSQAVEIAPSTALAAEVPVTMDRLKMAVDATLDAAKEIVLAKNIPLEKFRALVEKNIRGVREPGQTRDIMEQEYKLEGADLRVVLEALAMGKKQYDGEKKIEKGGVLNPAITDSQESVAMDQKFAEVTKTQPEDSVSPIMPGARVSAARDTQAPAEKKIIPLKPRPAKAELTVGSVAPKAVDRKLTDVVAASRLMGPVDQIKNLSTIEFRRMSSDPAEGARKVEDLLTALLATGYEERVNGINAWRKSPLNQMYLEISEEALSNSMSIPDVCSKRRKEKKDCLSPAEIKAIIGLNAKLRF